MYIYWLLSPSIRHGFSDDWSPPIALRTTREKDIPIFSTLHHFCHKTKQITLNLDCEFARFHDPLSLILVYKHNNIADLEFECRKEKWNDLAEIQVTLKHPRTFLLFTVVVVVVIVVVNIIVVATVSRKSVFSLLNKSHRLSNEWKNLVFLVNSPSLSLDSFIEVSQSVTMYVQTEQIQQLTAKWNHSRVKRVKHFSTHQSRKKAFPRRHHMCTSIHKWKWLPSDEKLCYSFQIVIHNWLHYVLVCVWERL